VQKRLKRRATGSTRKIESRKKIHAKFTQAARGLFHPRLKRAFPLRREFQHFARGTSGLLGRGNGCDPAVRFVLFEERVHLPHAAAPSAAEIRDDLFVQVVAVQRTQVQKTEQGRFGGNGGFH